MNSTFLVVIIGLSGCGKSYMIDYVLKNANVRIKKVIAVTTRPPRKCEKDGVDKFFRTEKIFEEERSRNQYCFVNEVYDYKYAFYRRDFFSTCNFRGKASRKGVVKRGGYQKASNITKRKL